MRLASFAFAVAFLGGCSVLNVSKDGGDDNLMLSGHDPVQMFSAGRAQPGRADTATDFLGGRYRFVSEESKRQFITQPGRYAPQFGGFCAHAMTFGIPVDGRTDHFKILGGKLYAFTSARARAFFELDQERNIQLAEHYWETEVKESMWQVQAWKRTVFRVPHYKSEEELTQAYEKKFGRKPE